MKINEKHLCELSTLDTPADKRGYLNKRGEVNRSYQRRWFVLRGNLLFYFERSEDVEPTGVIVLENCVVSLSETEDSYAFELSFGGHGTRTYILAADTRDEMEDWVRVLSRSSCSYLQTMISLLQSQVDDLDASSSTKPIEGPESSAMGDNRQSIEGRENESAGVSRQAPVVADELISFVDDLNSVTSQHHHDAEEEQSFC